MDVTNNVLELGQFRSSISRVIDSLREDIVALEISPGSKLPIASLSQRYKANPGAVREALSRLVTEGLVVAEDQKGFRTSPISAALLTDIMTTRIFIEVEALRRSIEKGDADWEANLVAAAHRLAKQDMFASGGVVSKEWRKLHRNYHLTLIAACGSRSLLQVQGLLYAQTERFHTLLDAHGLKKPRDSVAEHNRITTATLERNFSAASRALTDHYKKTVDLVVRSGLIK